MQRISKPINTIDLCNYGCGNLAKFVNGSNKLMCEDRHNKCPALRLKNSIGVKNCGRDYVKDYQNLPQESKDKINWKKGLTKDSDSRIMKAALAMEGQPGRFTGKRHSDSTKKLLSEYRTSYLKKSENRKNLGRHKKSWMEETFEHYLISNDISGWESEVHFYSEELKKNFYPDFIFENKKLIIELDGTQHRLSIDKDSIRDQWFKTKGYTVVRIPHETFKQRLFSGKGFLDLLGD